MDKVAFRFAKGRAFAERKPTLIDLQTVTRAGARNPRGSEGTAGKTTNHTNYTNYTNYTNQDILWTLFIRVIRVIRGCRIRISKSETNPNKDRNPKRQREG
jgi:hypothetical protein